MAEIKIGSILRASGEALSLAVGAADEEKAWPAHLGARLIVGAGHVVDAVDAGGLQSAGARAEIKRAIANALSEIPGSDSADCMRIGAGVAAVVLWVARAVAP